MRARRTVTQSQIAKATGLSQAAVSAVLSGAKAPVVADRTRREVLATAEKLGYVRRKVSVSAELTGAQVLIVENAPAARRTDQHWIAEAYQSFMGKILTASGHYLQKHGIGASVY